MKEGEILYRRVVGAETETLQFVIQQFWSRDLRKLIRHTVESRLHETEAGEEILAMAMVEAATRFMKKKHGRKNR